MSELLRTDEIQGDVIHEYDGIEEADNLLPRWWLMTFYGAIAFAFAYWIYFHTLEIGLAPNAQYAKEKELQLAARVVTEAELIELAQDPKVIQLGQKVFRTNCVSCHSDRGQGKNGPNLTDAYWLHGGSPTDIHKTIAYGVPLKGMIAWIPRLGPKSVGAVTAYVLSIRNTNVAGKAPEGKQWTPSVKPESIVTDAGAMDAGGTDAGDKDAGVQGVR